MIGGSRGKGPAVDTHIEVLIRYLKEQLMIEKQFLKVEDPYGTR